MEDEMLFDHIGQIVMSAILQGVVIGARETSTESISHLVDSSTQKATHEITKHLSYHLRAAKEKNANLQKDETKPAAPRIEKKIAEPIEEEIDLSSNCPF